MPKRIQRPKNAAEWKQLDADLASEKDEVMAAAHESKAAYDAIVPDRRDKGYRGDASQFFVAGELCRRRLVAVVTLGNCPNTDILCSNSAGTRFAHIQVKTFVPGIRTCSVGMKSERPYGENFFWILGGIPTPESGSEFEYYIIPSKDMASNMTACFRLWADTPGAKGQKRNAENNTVRTVQLPPGINLNGWDISQYRGRWDLIEQCLTQSK